MNKQRGFSIISAIVISLLVIGGGVYYLNINNDVSTETINIDSKQESESEVNPPQDQEKEAPAVTKISDGSKDLVVVTAPATIVVTPSVNTSNNLSEFIDGLKNCKEVKFGRSTTSQVLGSVINMNIDYSVSSKDYDCILGMELNSYKIEPSSELLNATNIQNATVQDTNGNPLDLSVFYKDLNTKSQSLIGKTASCKIGEARNDLIAFFSKTEGEFGYGDGWFLIGLSDLNCDGELVKELEKISQQ